MTVRKACNRVLQAFFFFACATAQADEATWKRLAEGRVAVMVRHAITEPGIGDPPNFRLGDCSTQRNLSAEGRTQARRLGEAFKARGIAPARVLSSEWCRCIDTAEAAFGRHVAAPALNSFFGERSTEPAQTAEVRRLLRGIKPGEVVVMVTHQVNISALTGQTSGMGEFVVVDGRSGKFIGRIAAP